MQDFNIQRSSSDQLDDFKENIYRKYLDVLIQHLTNRFPDIHLLEAFSMFDGKIWPIHDQTQLQVFGNESLHILTEHFSPGLVNEDESMTEWQVLKIQLFVQTLHFKLRLTAHMTLWSPWCRLKT